MDDQMWLDQFALLHRQLASVRQELLSGTDSLRLTMRKRFQRLEAEDLEFRLAMQDDRLDDLTRRVERLERKKSAT